MRVKQIRSRCLIKAIDAQLLQSDRIERTLVAVANRYKHEDGIALETAGNEGQDVRSRTVQPVGVFNDK